MVPAARIPHHDLRLEIKQSELSMGASMHSSEAQVKWVGRVVVVLAKAIQRGHKLWKGEV